MDINLIDNLSPVFFEQIFEKIDNLHDQVAMLLAYPQFAETIEQIWSRSNYVIGPSTNYLDELPWDYYLVFMEQMCGNFKELHLLPVSRFNTFSDYFRQFMYMKVHSFPNVTRAILTSSSGMMGDEDFNDLANLCPNLKVIKTNMKITGLYLQRFRHLEELYIDSYFGSTPLSNAIMQDICLYMKTLRILNIIDHFRSDLRLNNIDLPNLEVLMVNLDTIETMVDSILKLPKLKSLGVHYDNTRNFSLHSITILHDIIVAKSDSIRGITVNNVVLDLDDDWYDTVQLELPKLRKLICEHWIYGSLFLDEPHIDYNKIEVLSYNGWLIVNSSILAKTCKNFPNLRDLHVSENEANLQTLEAMKEVRSANFLRHRKPLRVFCDNKWEHFDDETMKKWMRDDFVRINVDGKDFEYINVGFQIDFENQ